LIYLDVPPAAGFSMTFLAVSWFLRNRHLLIGRNFHGGPGVTEELTGGGFALFGFIPTAEDHGLGRG